MVPFGGWSLPVQYSGIVKEHHAVRNAAGLFDVSHMGELRVRGDGAVAAVDRLVTNDASRLEDGRAMYTACCKADGGILDDLIVYREQSDNLLVVCNASNRAKISAHFQAELGSDVSFEDESDQTALMALQGPKAEEILLAAGGEDSIASLRLFSLGRGTIDGRNILVARTGYTGEDGFEIFSSNEDAAPIWRALVGAGEAYGLLPAGLGARDTLRLESRLCLYGNDITEETNPYEAGIGWVVKLKAGDFIGKPALEAVKAEGVSRKLVGFEMVGRGIARHDSGIVHPDSGARIGSVTSGSPAPTLGKNIGLGYVPMELAAVGTKLGIEIRGKVVEGVVVKTPFYRRER